MSSDPLVGMFFHSMVDGEVTWQGCVTHRNDRGYVVQLFSWWDGEPSDSKFVTFDEIADWRFYESAIAMAASRGCRESFGDGFCGRPVEWLVGNPVIFATLTVCARCAEFYARPKRRLKDSDFARQPKTLEQVRAEAVSELVGDLRAAHT